MLLTAVAFGMYVLLRAWNIPVTVDECSTAMTHVPRKVFDILFLKSDANPNNHILNTLLAKGFTGLFGWHPFVFRIPALLGALAYAWAGFLLCRRLSDNAWVGAFAYGMLLGQPYMLEFFSLARGYSLGLGCMTVAIWFAYRFFKENSRRDLLWSAFFAGLAVYGNFTQILFFAPFVGLLLLAAWQKKTDIAGFLHQTGPALAMTAAWVALLIVPLKRLSAHSEIKIWVRTDSLFRSVERTMDAAIHRNPLMGRDASEIFTWMAAAFMLIAVPVAVRKWWRRPNGLAGDFRIFPVLLLAGVLITNVLQAELMHITYLQPRLALLYWPLFALSLGAAAAWLYDGIGKWIWLPAAPIALMTFINVGTSVNLQEATDWWHDRDTYTVLHYIRNVQQTESHPEPYTFDSNSLLQNSYIFHTKRDPRNFGDIVRLGEWHPGKPDAYDKDFYYTNSEEAAQMLDTYEVVLRLPASDRMLLRKKRNNPS